MIKMNKKNGFTLIEIIVVLIILGVLAAVALPNLFSNINKSKGAEAIATFGPMKSIMEACCQKNSSCNGCSTTTLGQQNNFSYSLADTCANATISAGVPGGTSTAVGTYCIKAWSLLSDASTADYIMLNRTSSSTITCSGNGAFAGVC